MRKGCGRKLEGERERSEGMEAGEGRGVQMSPTNFEVLSALCCGTAGETHTRINNIICLYVKW